MKTLIHILKAHGPILLWSLPALAVLLVFLHYYAGFVSDDAFISFRYADHLARGLGLEWNPGYRVEGYSNFLWVVLISALQAVLRIPAPQGARALAWIAAACTVILIVAAARRERRRPAPELLVLAALPVVLSFPYQFWVATRLETPLFSLLLLLSVYLFTLEEESHVGRRWPSALAFLALALTRPEGAAFIIVPGIYLLSRVRSLTGLRQICRERGVWLGVFLGGMAIYLGWRLYYFGDLLPNTYYAKVGGQEVLDKGWEYLMRFVDQRPHALIMLLGILFLGGTASRLVALLVGTAITLTAIVVLEGGDWMREYRLLIPTMVVLAAALAVSLQHVSQDGSLSRRLAGTTGMILLCLFLQNNSGTPWEEWGPAFKGRTCDPLINMEGEMTAASARVGWWLKNNARPGDLIAVNHAGAVPYHSGLPTIDMVGLNDLHIARVPGGKHVKWDPEYVLRRKPTYVVLNTRDRPVDGKYRFGYWAGETLLVRHPEFQRRYKAVDEVWSWRHRPLDRRGTPFFATAYIMVFKRVAE